MRTCQQVVPDKSIVGKAGYLLSDSQKEALEIMGSNFFGLEEVMKYFGVKPSKSQILDLAQVPFNEQMLQFYRKNFLLVAVFPLSIFDIYSIVKNPLHANLFRSSTGLHDTQPVGWYENLPFSHNRGKLGWHLICKEPLINSLHYTLGEQKRLLLHSDKIPEAQVVAYATIGHYLQTGERLFGDTFVRCSDENQHGQTAIVGCFGHKDGLLGSYFNNGSFRGPTGLAVEKRP